MEIETSKRVRKVVKQRRKRDRGLVEPPMFEVREFVSEGWI